MSCVAGLMCCVYICRQVNVELARVVNAAGGWPVDTRTADDPHTKADLLFQVRYRAVCLFLQMGPANTRA